MLYRIVGLVIMAVFYGFYLAKLIILNMQSIKTNQMGTGDKTKKVLCVERVTSLATMACGISGVASILLVNKFPAPKVQVVGIVVGVVAVVFFDAATITMKNSWRVGIPNEKTSLVTTGIYSWSRNPAFVGFHLLYISICLMFFNVGLAVVSVWAAVMLHLQILQEEEHMHRMFGAEYDEYKQRTKRYFGRW